MTMNKRAIPIKIELYREFFDFEAWKAKEGRELLFSGMFETSETLDEVQLEISKAYFGDKGNDGFKVDLYEKVGEIREIVFTTLWGLDLEAVIEMVKTRYKKIENTDESLYVKKLNPQLEIIFDDPCLTSEDASELLGILNEEIGNKNFELIRVENQYSWGANGSTGEFIISILSDLTVKALEKIYKFIKSKKADFSYNPKLEIDKLRDAMLINFNVNAINLKVQSFEKTDSGTSITLVSRYEIFEIIIDKEGSIIKLNRKNAN